MDQKRTPSPKEDSLARQFSLFALVMGQFLGASGAGVGLGWYLWKMRGFPWWTILVTSLLGLYAASYQVYRYSRILQGRQNKKEGR
jgi:F0F1-type ATP synthase assembly protein I